MILTFPKMLCLFFFFKNYMDYLSRLYEREIKDFFEVAKIKMTGATKEGKKFGKFLKKHFLFIFVSGWQILSYMFLLFQVAAKTQKYVHKFWPINSSIRGCRFDTNFVG